MKCHTWLPATFSLAWSCWAALAMICCCKVLTCCNSLWTRDWTSESTCRCNVNRNFSFNNSHCSSRSWFSRLKSWHVRSNLATIRSFEIRSSFSYLYEYINFNYLMIGLRYLLDFSASQFWLRVSVDVHVSVFPSWYALDVRLDQ
jgi:hypothetical protein